VGKDVGHENVDEVGEGEGQGDADKHQATSNKHQKAVWEQQAPKFIKF